ncbi:MAG: T9SS type A sorting domain-containing protein [Bacteroidia bacterium]
MKKNLLLIILLISVIAGKTNAQCVPDPTITDPGVYPDSATGLPPACLGVPYSTTIQVRVLTDTTFNGLPVVITSVDIMNVIGMPAGFTYACVPASCSFPGGSNGCIQITGTASTVGNFPLTVEVEANGTVFGVPISQPSTINYYSIQVNSCVGIAENIASLNFDLLQNNPNPFDKFTLVSFTSPVSGNFKLKVYNLIGKEVYHQNIRGEAGTNVVKIDAQDFVPGIYVYMLDNGVTTLSKRMIVSNKQ